MDEKNEHQMHCKLILKYTRATGQMKLSYLNCDPQNNLYTTLHLKMIQKLKV